MWILIYLLSLQQPTLQQQTCNSTIFGFEGDTLSGGYTNETVMGVASRNLKRGTHVTVQLGSRSVRAVVVDRGPWGRIVPKGYPCPKGGRVRADGSCWYNAAKEYKACGKAGIYPLQERCYTQPSKWNGCLDLTPATARALHHDGWEKITVFWYSRRPKRKPKRPES